jgi:hypothetical protein
VFVVERSFDASNFVEIANVKAAGNSTKNINYSIVDAQPVLTEVNYYRLKQIDIDGKYSYSSVIAIDFNITSNWQNLMTISPNPVVDKMDLGYNFKPDELIECKISDITGKIIHSFKFVSTILYISLKQPPQDRLILPPHFTIPFSV